MYPDLFDPDQRWDCDHLNRAGAERMTALVADGFAAVLTGS